ncbi:MAG: hypothetical protein AB8C13_06610 [Phycisphaerales bacterium]
MSEPTPSDQPPISSASAAKWCTVASILLIIALSWPFILAQNTSGRGAFDDLIYHWPTVQTFADELPTPNLSNYLSATTPGYHLELAIVHRLGASRTLVQLYASLWTVLLLATLAWRFGKSFGKQGLLVMLPLFASIYILFPAIWLLPDNAAWLGVLLMLILAIEKPPTLRVILASGLLLTILVFIRQIHIWAAALIWTSAWVGTQSQLPNNTTLPSLFSDPASRLKRLTPALIAALPAALILFWLYTLWGGLVPPNFQNNHQGANPATPAFILTQIAILSAFYAPILLPQLLTVIRTHISWIITIAVLGLIIGILPHTSMSTQDGRFSGWWSIAHKLPTIANRSPFIILGALAGAIACLLWVSMLNRRDAWIFSIGLIAFIAAQSANFASWQRYHEPFLLILGSLIFTRVPAIYNAPKKAIIGSVALALLMGAITVSALKNAEQVQIPTSSATIIPTTESTIHQHSEPITP